MIWAWISAKGLFGLAKGAWVAICVAAAALAIGLYVHAEHKKQTEHDTLEQTVGAQGVVVAGQTQTLNQLKDANNAEQTLKSDNGRSAARYNQCLQDSTRPAACERYRPNADGK